MVDWGNLYAERAQHDQKDLVSGVGNTIIQMAAGFPEPSLFPVQEISKVVTELLSTKQEDILQYNAPGGYEPLRTWISERVAPELHLQVQQVLLTHGAQQGLDIITKILVDPGDWILVEAPSFHGALWVFQAAGARVCSISVDSQGIILEELETKLQEMSNQNCLPKFIYTIPTFHNPTGYTATLERRHGMLKLAGQYGIPIIEDVPYNALWYDISPPPTLLELSGTEQVIQLGTFSKTLCPALRVGWMIGSHEIMKKAWHFKHIADTCSNGLMQHVVYQLCLNGFLDWNISRAREIYRAKRDALEKAFSHSNLPEVTCSKPNGGFFAWLQLPEKLSSTKVQQLAFKNGVAVAAAPMFFLDRSMDNACRLTISFSSAEEIEVGVIKLLETIHSLLIVN